MLWFVCGGKHGKNIHYESITQFLGQKYQVLFTGNDRNQSINAACQTDIVFIHPILQLYCRIIDP